MPKKENRNIPLPFQYLMKGSIFELLAYVCERLRLKNFLIFGKTYVYSRGVDMLKCVRKYKDAVVCRAKENDLPLILGCNGNESKKDLYLKYFNSGYECYFVKCENKCLGYLWAFNDSTVLTFDSYRKSNITISIPAGYSFLGDGYVRPEYRLRGVFPLLLDSVFRIFRNDCGKSGVMAQIIFSNKNSINTHDRMGFTRTATVYYVWIMGVQFLIVQYPDGKKLIKLLNGQTVVEL